MKLIEKVKRGQFCPEDIFAPHWNGEMAGWTSYRDESGADDSYAVEEVCEPAVGVGDVMSTTFSSSNEVRFR